MIEEARAARINPSPKSPVITSGTYLIVDMNIIIAKAPIAQ